MSGDGGLEDVTTEHLRRVLKMVLNDLFQAQDAWEAVMTAESQGQIDKKDPENQRFREWLHLDEYVLEEFSEFLKTCIYEDVVKLDFH